MGSGPEVFPVDSPGCQLTHQSVCKWRDFSRPIMNDGDTCDEGSDAHRDRCTVSATRRGTRRNGLDLYLNRRRHIDCLSACPNIQVRYISRPNRFTIEVHYGRQYCFSNSARDHDRIDRAQVRRSYRSSRICRPVRWVCHLDRDTCQVARQCSRNCYILDSPIASRKVPVHGRSEHFIEPAAMHPIPATQCSDHNATTFPITLSNRILSHSTYLVSSCREFCSQGPRNRPVGGCAPAPSHHKAVYAFAP